VSHSPAKLGSGPVDPQYRTGWSQITNLIETGGSWSGRERNCCYLNLGGSGAFADVSYASGLDFPDDARAVASVDWDHDGDLDLWITNRTAPRLRFLRNNTGDGAGVVVRLQGTTGNRDAIGARLELADAAVDKERAPSVVRFVTAGSGFLAQSSKWVHLGVGQAAGPFRLQVTWPGGARETINGLEAGGRYRVVQGSGMARREKPREIDLAAGGLETVAPTGVARIPLLERLPLPAIEFLDDRDQVRRLEPTGRATLVNLWATWCLPCVKELHEFNERYDELRKADLEVVTLSVDGLREGKPGALSLVRQFMAKHELPFGSRRAMPAAVDRLDAIHDVVLTTRTQLDDKITLPVPASFLLDASGHLAVIYKGPVTVDQLLADARMLSSSADQDPAVAYAGRWFLRPHGLGSVAVRVADRLVRRGHLDESLPFAQLAADLSARNGNPFDLKHKAAQALVDLGNAWDEKQEFAQAATAYRLARRVDPSDAAAVTNLGNATLRMGDQRTAEKYYRDAIALDPNQLQARMNLGAIFLQREQVFDAVKHLGEAVRINPRFPQAHNMLGMALLRQGRRSSARDHFQKAVDLDPKFKAARDNLKALSATLSAGGGR